MASLKRPSGSALPAWRRVSEGKTIWRYEGKGKATYTQHWNEKYACWIALDTAEHVVLDAANGKPLRTQALAEKVDWRRYDADAGKYVLLADVNLAKQTPPLSVFPAQFCNILLGDYHCFLCDTEASKKLGPPYCVGRVHLETEKSSISKCRSRWSARRASRISLCTANRKPPRRSTRAASTWRRIRDRAATAGGGATSAARRRLAVRSISRRCLVSPTSSTAEPRCWMRRRCWPSTTSAPPGQTWSLNSISYAEGRLYHRSIKEIVCIGK